jgi:hypothetical protein
MGLPNTGYKTNGSWVIAVGDCRSRVCIWLLVGNRTPDLTVELLEDGTTQTTHHVTPSQARKGRPPRRLY